MTVRPATVADAREIAEIHVAAWRAVYPGLLAQEVLDGLSVDARERRWSSMLAHPEPGDRCTVLERDARIVAWCGHGPRRDRSDTGDGEVRGLYADPAARGTGCGATLLAEAFTHLDARHAQTVVWLLVGNDRALATYERAGFRRTGEVVAVDGHPGARQQLLRRPAAR